MKRLPKSFEEQVLRKRGIIWDEEFNQCYFNERHTSEGETLYKVTRGGQKSRILSYDVSPYEIAAIALEAIAVRHGGIGSFMYDWWKNDLPDGVFKKVREIWNDTN